MPNKRSVLPVGGSVVNAHNAARKNAPIVSTRASMGQLSTGTNVVLPPATGGASTSSGSTLSTQSPSALSVGGSGSAGVGSEASAFDHVHPMPGSFGASGAGHGAGFMPDPGATAHSPFYLIGDDGVWHAQTSITNLGTVTVGTWQASTIGSGYLTALGASGSGHSAGIAPDPGSTAGSTRFLREDATWAVPSGGSGGGGIPAWSSGMSVTANQTLAYGSDGNVYICQGSGGATNSPIGDVGTNWKLWALQSNLTLNCGVGQAFADTFASSSSPGGAMSPGIQTAINFIASAVGAVSPTVATVTIQQTNNPSTTCSAAGSTSTVKCTTNIPIGASLLFKGDVTSALKGATTTVTSSSYSSGTYTLTVSTLSSAPASGDTFYYAPYYGTNGITINLPTIGPNVAIQGSLSTPAMPAFYPSVSAGSGGSLSGVYYVAVSYTWADASGTTRETMPGPVTSQTTGSGTLTVSGFTLPTGITGANVYASNSSGGTLYKQGAMSVSGGVTSNFTISSYSSSTAGATSNAAAPTYPCAMMFGTTNAFNITAGSGVALSGLYLRGTSSSSGVGLRVAGCGVTLSVGLPTVVSTFGVGMSITQSGVMNTTSTQVDACSGGYVAQQRGYFSAGASVCLSVRCSGSGFSTGNTCGTIACLGAFVGFSTTGFTALEGGYVQTTPSNPTGGTAVPTYGCTTQASPAFGTIASNNSYISNT